MIGRQQTIALDERPFIELPVFLLQIAPITRLMPVQGIPGVILISTGLAGSVVGDDAAVGLRSSARGAAGRRSVALGRGEYTR
jgi:hypothetical protein